MNDFRSEYQSAVQDMDTLGMKEIHIDALSVMDEGRHRKRMRKKVQRMTATTFSAVCVIFLCGFGTVKAAEYIGNVIRVSEWGFESGDAATMARNEAEGSTVYVTGEEVGLALGEAEVSAGAACPAAAMPEEGIHAGKVSETAGMEEATLVKDIQYGDAGLEAEGRDSGTETLKKGKASDAGTSEEEWMSGMGATEEGKAAGTESAEGGMPEALAGTAEETETAEKETEWQKTAETQECDMLPI